MFANQFLFNLQRIDLLHHLRQLAHSGDAVQMHDAQHFAQHAGKVQVYHTQIATEHFVGHIAILQDTSQTFYHQHTSRHIVFLTKSINLIDRGRGKLDAGLLKLQIGSSSAVQQWKHGAETRTDTEACQRGIHTVKSNMKIGTVIRFRFQVKDSHLIQELLHPIG